MSANDWRKDREALMERIENLRQQGTCYSCHDLATGDVFGEQCDIYEDERFRIVLDPYPRMLGHTIVVYKPHREDISCLSDEETALVFQVCVWIIRAMKDALGAEKVYLNTMCDGGINHLHIQLFPRYPGESIGSRRFVHERAPLVDGEATATRIRNALRTVDRPECLSQT